MTGSMIILDVLKKHNICCTVTIGEKNYYEPNTKTIYLTPNVYGKQTLAGLAISLHEFSHLLQHIEKYKPFILSKYIKSYLVNIILEWNASKRAKKMLFQYLTKYQYQYCKGILDKLFLTHLIPAIMFYCVMTGCGIVIVKALWN